ncbi:nucleotidyltransferase domain-containing protein [Hymenobacter psychrophilus]|uniref:nucleotidyltransferase domain-containing protein n=1 Tax=Hymenobacter psychrophilus TaxID=651662 RepID=UPI001114797D|nr:nucleotidyltransferase domain-containing protein [Hymenobacter psychrophilus]
MEATNIINKISNALWDLNSNNVEAFFYLFGSYIVDPNKANDIDILVIYKKDTIEIQNKLNKIHESYLFHVIYLTEYEEREFNFISQQKALKIAPVPRATLH